MTVSKPKLSLQPSELTFNYQLGHALPPSQTVVISSNGPSLDFTATQPLVNGLALDKTSGKTPASVSLGLAPPFPPAGAYKTTITVNSPEASGPQDLAVTLNVRD